MYATVEWTDRKGVVHLDGIAEPVSVVTVMDVVESKGGTVSKFSRITMMDRDTMAPLLEVSR